MSKTRETKRVFVQSVQPGWVLAEAEIRADKPEVVLYTVDKIVIRDYDTFDLYVRYSYGVAHDGMDLSGTIVLHKERYDFVTPINTRRAS
jgi:hypothetical protein